MTYCRRLFPLLCIVSILSGENPPPPASLSVQGSYAARSGQILHQVDGYINETTNPAIIVTYDPALNDDEPLDGEGIW